MGDKCQFFIQIIKVKLTQIHSLICRLTGAPALEWQDRSRDHSVSYLHIFMSSPIIKIVIYIANVFLTLSVLLLHCVNLGGFNCPSQKWFNIVYLDEERPPKKFRSHATIFSLEKLSFFHFLGHEILIWGDIINSTTYVGYFDGNWPPWKFWSHTTIILIGPTSFFDWFYNFLVDQIWPKKVKKIDKKNEWG